LLEITLWRDYDRSRASPAWRADPIACGCSEFLQAR
jgi:hypothetical protein